MILMITPLAKAQSCALAIEESTGESVQLCSDLAQAILQLQKHEFKAVVFDDLLPDADEHLEQALQKHLASAGPVYVNFAVSGVARITSLVRSALERRKRELATARQDAELSVRHELKESVTALLLSCEFALQVPNLPPLAEDKLQAVEAIVREMSLKLGAAN